jgi:hypothetical protein
MANSNLEWELRKVEEKAEHLRSVLRRNGDRDTRERTRHDRPRQDHQTDRRSRTYSPSYSPEAYHPRGNNQSLSTSPSYCPQGLKCSASMMEAAMQTLDDIAKIQRLNKTHRGFDYMRECLSLTYTKKGEINSSSSLLLS